MPIGFVLIFILIGSGIGIWAMVIQGKERDARELAKKTAKPIWYYRLNDDNIGPLSHNDIIPLIADGTIKNETLMWKVGEQDWQCARTLFPEPFRTIPPPPNAIINLPQVPVPDDTIPTGTTVPPRTGLAIASLVCGVIGSVISITSIPAVICGHVALYKIKKDPAYFGGKNMAIAGLILGYIAIALALILGTMKGILWAQLRQMGY